MLATIDRHMVSSRPANQKNKNAMPSKDGSSDESSWMPASSRIPRADSPRQAPGSSADSTFVNLKGLLSTILRTSERVPKFEGCSSRTIRSITQ